MNNNIPLTPRQLSPKTPFPPSVLPLPHIPPRVSPTQPSILPLKTTATANTNNTFAHTTSTTNATQPSQQSYLVLKKQLKDQELLNEELALKLVRAKRSLLRLQFERKLLYERLELNPSDDESHNAGDDDEGADTDDVADADGEPVVKRRKRSKDPNAPKRPVNVFFLFCQLERDRLKQAHPKLSRAEITKLLSSQWKDMSEDDKRRYYELYEKEKEKYHEAMAEYQGPSGPTEDGPESIVEEVAAEDDEEEVDTNSMQL